MQKNSALSGSGASMHWRQRGRVRRKGKVAPQTRHESGKKREKRARKVRRTAEAPALATEARLLLEKIHPRLTSHSSRIGSDSKPGAPTTQGAPTKYQPFGFAPGGDMRRTAPDGAECARLPRSTIHSKTVYVRFPAYPDRKSTRLNSSHLGI